MYTTISTEHHMAMWQDEKDVVLDLLPVSLNITSHDPKAFFTAVMQRNANREQRSVVWTWQPFTTSMAQDGKAENPTVQCSNLIFQEEK